MGASGDRFMAQHHEVQSDTSVKRWLEFAYAIAGSAPAHDGCTIGDYHDGATLLDDAPHLGKCFFIVGGAFDALAGNGFAKIDAAFAALDVAPTDGPWPGVKPCDWWDARTDKMDWCKKITAKMRDVGRAL